MPMCDACQCMHNGRNRHVSVHCELSTALVSGAANARRRFSRFSRLLFDMLCIPDGHRAMTLPRHVSACSGRLRGRDSISYCRDDAWS
eukprot:COSAG06_NODE_5152_length_3677_cov_1.804080_3_plen_88_part_00